MTEVLPVDKENIGARIYRIRQDKKLSQDKFASLIGYSKQFISFIENGKTNPSDEFIHKATLAFNVNIEWLKTRIGEINLSSEDKVDGKLLDWL